MDELHRRAKKSGGALPRCECEKNEEGGWTAILLWKGKVALARGGSKRRAREAAAVHALRFWFANARVVVRRPNL